MEIRLQKLLAMAGVASRRKAEELIIVGRVTVNGVIVSELGAKATPADILEVDGKPVGGVAQKKTYIMLHKPEGVVTTVTDPFERTTVMECIKDFYDDPANAGIRLYPVGRLDYDSSGLLLMTNDGDWTNILTHPKHEVSKTYVAIIKGLPTEETLRDFREGIVIDGRPTSKCEITVKQNTVQQNHRQYSQQTNRHQNNKQSTNTELSQKNHENPQPNASDNPSSTPTTKVVITIKEGRNRQIRKMCEAIGHPVVRLKRIAVGGVELGTLPRGKWRHLTAQEVASC